MSQLSFWTYDSYLCVHSAHTSGCRSSLNRGPWTTACLMTKTTELLKIRQTWIPQHNLCSRLHVSTSSPPARALTAKLGSHYHWQYCCCTPSLWPLVFIFEILEKKIKTSQALWNIFGLSFSSLFRLRMCGKKKCNAVFLLVWLGCWLLGVAGGHWWCRLVRAGSSALAVCDGQHRENMHRMALARRQLAKLWFAFLRAGSEVASAHAPPSSGSSTVHGGLPWAPLCCCAVSMY